MPRIWIIISIIGAVLVSSGMTVLVLRSQKPITVNSNSSNLNVTNAVNRNQNVAASNENANTSNIDKANINTESVNIGSAPAKIVTTPKATSKPTPIVNTAPAVDPAIKIELCKSKADTAKTASITVCTEAATQLYQHNPSYISLSATLVGANKSLADCDTSLTPEELQTLSPSQVSSLISQCISLNNSNIANIKNQIDSIKSQYLATIPLCTDAEYQDTYTKCLNS